MNRRGFLLGMLAAGAAPAIVKAANIMPLFVRKEAAGLFIPETVALGGSTILTIDMITREALRLAHNNMNFIETINRQFNAPREVSKIVARWQAI